MPENHPRKNQDTPQITASAQQAPPAIYYIYPSLAGPLAHWPGHFHRAQAMGFNTILMAPPLAAREACVPGEPPLVEDHDILHAALGPGIAEAALTDLASQAKAANLSLALDIDISKIDSRARLLVEQPDWFVPATHGAAFRYLAEDDVTADWWNDRIAAYQKMGISGFRCIALGAVPPAVWARLIKAAKDRDPGVMFWAWTPGLTPDAMMDLRGRGFDHTFSSSCWWDFKAMWLNEDADRLAPIAPAIAMPEPPFGFRCADIDRGGRFSQRALALAAHYAPGWLMPMGYEYGAASLDDRAHDPVARFKDLQAAPNFDLTGAIAAANRLRAAAPICKHPASARVVSSAGAGTAIMAHESQCGEARVMMINASTASEQHAALSTVLPMLRLDGAKLQRLDALDVTDFDAASTVSLAPAETAVFRAIPLPPIRLTIPKQAELPPRIVIENITPKVDDGKFPVRRIAGETVEIEADIFSDGHGRLGASAAWRHADSEIWQTCPMTPIGNDRWAGKFSLDRLGRYSFKIMAWVDEYTTLAADIKQKKDAGQPIQLDIDELQQIVQEAAKVPADTEATIFLDSLNEASTADQERRYELLSGQTTAAFMHKFAARKFLTQSADVTLDAERSAAAFAAWYEIFPRSQGGAESRHGTLLDVIDRLPAIRAMGFDVLYFPPIHPIGQTNRKGRNNALTASPDDPGSPYAIGAAEGGHDAIHPQLGTIQDFQKLQESAAANGLEIALDFAIQCSPDHPWLKSHPDWFHWRPDGSIRYAENPPKKYEDIVNVDFYAPGAQPSLWNALRDVIQFWVDQGVRLFRVDNPHTKPLPFWEWMIADIRARHPDVIFLAEAFTRPKLMARLAKIGFSQSYTYFTWRHTKQELTAYMRELTATPLKDYFRPHFFVNTPDINPYFLQKSGRAGFLIRAALAATLSGLWGVYNGFELCEASAVPGREEYLDSEKYQIRAWDMERAGNIIAEISKLNHIRRSNAALRSHLGIRFLNANNENILCFYKAAEDGNVILVAVNLDPTSLHEAMIEIPLWHFGYGDDGALTVDDLMGGSHFILPGKFQHIRLNPAELPFHIWRLQPAVR